MLSLVPVLMLAVSTLTAQNDAITRFFDRYMEDERFTVVYVSPKLFQMLSKITLDDPEWANFQSVIKDLGGLRVLTSDSIPNGTALYKEALGKVPVAEYSELITVRDGQENVRIWTKDKGNVIEELLLLVGAPTEFTLLSFTGKIDLDKIATLSKSIDIDGIDQLDKIKGSKGDKGDKGEKGDKGDKGDKGQKN